MLRKISSPSRPASQALMRSSTSLRLMSRSSVFSRFSFFSIGFSSNFGGIAGRWAKFHLPRLPPPPRAPDLEQMPDRRREHVAVALEVVLVPREASQRARDVGGDGGFLGDDQRFRHGRAVRRAADSTEGEAGGARTALPRTAQRAGRAPSRARARLRGPGLPSGRIGRRRGERRRSECRGRPALLLPARSPEGHCAPSRGGQRAQ